MAFDPHKPTPPSPAEKRAGMELPADWLVPLLAQRASLVEIGGGNGARAETLLKKLSGSQAYQAFEPSSSLARAAQARLAGRGTVITHDPARALPLPPASQDAVLTLELLEYLRMDQFYMAVAEARRVLRPGGLWALRALCPQEGLLARFSAWQLTRREGCQALELTHYISPEDWRELENRREICGSATSKAFGSASSKAFGFAGIKRQVLLLERI